MVSGHITYRPAFMSAYNNLSTTCLDIFMY